VAPPLLLSSVEVLPPQLCSEVRPH